MWSVGEYAAELGRLRADGDPEADQHVSAFLRMGVARLQSVLHLCGVTADGRLCHTLGPGPGAVFRDIKAVIKPPPEMGVGSFQALGCA